MSIQTRVIATLFLSFCRFSGPQGMVLSSFSITQSRTKAKVRPAKRKARLALTVTLPLTAKEVEELALDHADEQQRKRVRLISSSC